MINITLTTKSISGLKKALDGISRKLSKNLSEALDDSVRMIKRNIVDEAPERTGGLKRKIMALPVNKSRAGSISLLAESSRRLTLEIDLSRRSDRVINWVNYGTGIYGPYGSPIVPVTSRFLVFEIDGETFFRRSVLGQKPQHFIEKGVNRSRLAVLSKIRAALKT